MIFSSLAALGYGAAMGCAAGVPGLLTPKRVVGTLVVSVATLYSASFLPWSLMRESIRAGRAHVSALLQTPVCYECGVALATTIGVMSIHMALTFHSHLRGVNMIHAEPELQIAFAIMVLHISFAPLLLGTALTVFDTGNVHWTLALAMFATSVVLVACYAVEAAHLGWVPGIPTNIGLFLFGVACAHVPGALREIYTPGSSTWRTTCTELALIGALSAIYIDAVPFVMELVGSAEITGAATDSTAPGTFSPPRQKQDEPRPCAGGEGCTSS